MFKLLVVDDEKNIADGLAEVFQVSELPLKEVRCVYSADEALSLFSETIYDIVVSDIKMPWMDGLELLERVRAFWPHTRFVFLTGHSDFELVQKALKSGADDYLLKCVDDEEIITCIRKITARIEEDLEKMMAVEQAKMQAINALPFLQNKLVKELLDVKCRTDKEYMTEQFHLLNIPFDLNKQMTVFVLRIDEWEEGRKVQEDMVVQYAINNILDGILQPRCIASSFRYEDGLIAILLQPCQEDYAISEKLLRQVLMEAQDTVYKVIGVVVSMVFTQGLFSVSGLPEMMRLLTTCMKQSLNRGKFICVDDLRSFKGFPMLVDKMNSHLMRIISHCDIDLFKEYMDTISSKASDAINHSDQYLCILFLNISFCFLNYMLEQNCLALLDAFTMERLVNFYQFKTIEEMTGFFVQLLERVSLLKDSFQSNPRQEIINQLKAYINENLSRAISLDELCQKFFFSPSYLSRTFSRITGESINSYITQKKMEHAGHILVNSDMAIHDVARKVGYDNTNYFSKVFRKYHGISPHEYKIYIMGRKT